MAFGNSSPFSGIDASTTLNNLLAMGPATSVTNGYLLATDWVIFNGKEDAIAKSVGFLTWNGSAFIFKNESYVITTSPGLTISSTDVSNWNEVYNWMNNAKSTGERITGTHAGTLFDMSITDDYLYVCVATGNAATAKWKKLILFQSI